MPFRHFLNISNQSNQPSEIEAKSIIVKKTTIQGQEM